MSTATQRTFSFSDASVNVAMPSPGTTSGLSNPDQSHIFLRSPAPALHIVKIRQILSSGYQEMYYASREQSKQPRVQTWNLCYKTRQWFHECPKNAPNHFSLLYRLELLYTIIILVSPSHQYPVLDDYSKAILFDRCMDFISQIHQVLENPSVLPFFTFLDIERVYQVGLKFVRVLSENFDLLLSPTVPTPPPVPEGTPGPPLLGEEDRINCRPRATRCLTYVRDLLQYCSRKWDLQDLLEDFERQSATLNSMLTDNSMGYTVNYDAFTQAPTSSGMPLAGTAYSGYHLG